MSDHADHPQDPTAPEGSDAHTHHDHGHDPNLAHHFDTMEQQFESGKLGMWVFLATEILMFGGLFCAYAIYRGNNPDIFLFAHHALDTNLGALNTAVLLASSFTMAVGVKAASQGRKALLLVMLAITFMGGVGFMVVKAKEYTDKFAHGIYPGQLNAYYSTAEAFENEKAKEDALLHTTDYIEGKFKKHGGSYGGDHGDGHQGGDGAGHDPEHKEGPECSHADPHATRDIPEVGEQPPASPAPNAEAGHGPAHADGRDVVEPGDTTGVELDDPVGGSTSGAATAGTDSDPLLVTSPEVVSGVWPPIPADHATIPPPANLAAATNAPFLDAPPRVGPLAGMVSGPAERQAYALEGPKYPGYENLAPLDQERLHIFFQIYFVMTGLHGLHVLIGMGLIAWVFVAAIRQGFGPHYYAPVDIVGLYWHLVDLIWIFLFPLLYLIH